MAEYWRFYWPLAVTGLAMVLGVQFQNAALARYPEAVTELAVFALSYGTFGFFRASLNFIAQLSNVFARSPVGTRRCQRFVLVAGLLICAPLLVLGGSDAGAGLLRSAYGIEAQLAHRVQDYLLFLSPLILLGAQRFYYTGLLVQARLTGWVTNLNLLFLSVQIAALVVGFNLGLAPVYVLVGSELVAIVCQLAATLWIKRIYYRPPADVDQDVPDYRDLVRFFIPVAMTGVMFALSRPVLYAFVSRTPSGLVAIAAMRVAFDFAMLFQQAANQFRHFFVTFGLDDIRRKRRFMALIAAGLTAVMLGFALTPLSAWIWNDLMRIPANVQPLALDVFLVMCALPSIIILRNYFHGRLMVERRTVGMAAGSMLRVAAIYGAAWFFFERGLLDHISASLILLLGFVVETGVVFQAAVRGQGERVKATLKR